MKILFKLTSRSRRDKCFATLDSILDNVSNDNYRVWITVDEDDEAMKWDNIKDVALKYNNSQITMCSGISKNKIDAINRDVNTIKYEYQILCNVSDDQLFIKKGFDDVIRDAFINKSLMQPDLDLFVHFPDGNQKKLATMSIMGRTYYERDKYIYHPDYKSLFCDDEAQEVAIKRACYKFVDDDIFVHNHPAWGKAQTDAQYQHTESFWNEDELTFNRRKAIDFGI